MVYTPGVLLMVRALSIGGCERDLTKMALALDRSRYQPHVACFQSDGPRYPELVSGGVPILELPVRSFMSWSAMKGAWKLLDYIRRHRIRVVHAFDVPMDLFGAPVAKLAGVPAIVTCQLSYRALYGPKERRLLRLTDRIAHCIVVNSEAVKRDLIASERISEKRILVSYNGVDGTVFFSRRQRRKEVAGAPLVIGTVCVLRQEKRIDLLLQAFAGVRHRVPGMKLLIVGSGAKQDEWQTLAGRLGIAADSVFVPAQQDVASWMQSMDIFVISSESESFPNALLEAMACGCCVIGSRVGGIPELIREGTDGMLFSSGDAAELEACLCRVIDDADLRTRFGEAASANALSNFSIRAAARRTEALYDSLLRPAS